MKKSIAVLGLGKFGRSLVRKLSELKADVLAADYDEAVVKEVADLCSEAVCADLSREESLKELDLSDMDIVVVAVGRNLEASIFAVSAAKEQGVPYILAKSTSDRMTSILMKVGADSVIMPEEYAGIKTAYKLMEDAMPDQIKPEDIASAPKKAAPDYSLLADQLREFAKTEPSLMPLLSNASALLYDALADVNWAGFYLRREKGGAPELVLGPFQGKTACILIPWGRGVCGTAAEQDRTQLVPDVHEFPGHIACDSASNSEIVVPIHGRNGSVVGVLDIDSPLKERFDETDREGLEQFVRVLEECGEWA